MTNPERIRTALQARPPHRSEDPDRKHAAVALILRQKQSGLDMFFIRRSEHDDDPWSGNIAFPGGKIDEEDDHSLQAAMRETSEEVGIDLEGAELLGRLDDIAGAYLPVRISCFVFLLPGKAPRPTLNEEVRETFWFPLDELADPHRHHTARVEWHGRQRLVPGIDLLGEGGPVLWGITYRLVTQFLDRIEQAEQLTG